MDTELWQTQKYCWRTIRNVYTVVPDTVSVWIEDFSGKYYPSDTPITQPYQKQTYSFHYIISGSGYFAEQGKMSHLTAGDVFFIAPGLVNYYPNPQNPWCYAGVSFSSPEMGGCFAKAGLSSTMSIRSGPLCGRIGDAIRRMVSDSTEDSSGRYRMSADIFTLLACLHEREAASGPGLSHSYADTAKAYINEHYADPTLSLPHVARAVNVSVPYLCRVFRESSDMPMRKYLIQLRMSMAAKLLAETAASAGEIAWNVGYSDPAHFCKSFRAFHGVTPTQYRKEHQRQQS